MKNNRILSHWVWGTLMLLAAAFVLANQFGGFVDIGIGSIIVAVLAVSFIVQCVAHLSFAPLPIPLAVLYYVFQTPLNFPVLQIWTLLLAALLATIGLFVLLPHKHRDGTFWGGHAHRHYSRGGDRHPQMPVEDCDKENNPSVNVSFGAVSRYLHSDCLETVQLYCNLGALEVFFDKAELSPNGAVANCFCSLGGMTIFVPKHWHVIDNLNCTLGGVEIDNRFAAPTENAPQLTITGNVLLGGIEVRFV